MKRFAILIFLFPSAINAMDPKVCNSNTLGKQLYNKNNPLFTSKESECLLFFNEQVVIALGCFKRLSQETQNIILKRGDQNDLKEALNDLAKGFINYCRTYKSKYEFDSTKYTVDSLATALLKMSNAITNNLIEQPTDKPTAFIFALTKLLTPEERDQISMQNYKKNRDQADRILRLLATFVVVKYVDLGLVKNDVREKANAEREFLVHKHFFYRLAQ